MNPSNSSNPSILLTFDIEDWFQVENFKPYIPFSSWPSCEFRVEKNTHRILNLLDSHELVNPTNPINPSNPKNPTNPSNSSNSKNSPKATFFVLGWIAERLPHLVREIHSRGHEVASHGSQHTLCTDCSSGELKRDLSDSKKLLEDITGAPVYGYRAPSFSISDDILKIIEQCGYLYDSSYNSFGIHGRYGHLDISRDGARGIAIPVNQKSAIENRQFYELPISNINFKKPFSSKLSAISSEQNGGTFVLPWGGGGYFRLIPFPLFKIGIRFVLGQQNAYLFYFHPWEIDPDQPKVNGASAFHKFRHYVNLSKNHSKLTKMIKSFSNCSFFTCIQYLEKTWRGQEAGHTGGEAEGVVESR